MFYLSQTLHPPLLYRLLQRHRVALRPTRFISTVKRSFAHINPFVVLGLHKTLTLALTHAPAIYLKKHIEASATLIL